MAAHRAQWKGHLKIGGLSCAVDLYTAASTAERISFHMINAATGNRLKRQFVDSETGEVVERDQQVKGFELGNGDHVMIDPDDVAAVVPDADKTLEAEAFISCDGIDDIYFDKPYYLVPVEDADHEAFASIRDALLKTETTAIARTVLFRRMRTVLIRAHGAGLIATTLNFDYEVRSSEEAFKQVARIPHLYEAIDCCILRWWNIGQTVRFSSSFCILLQIWTQKSRRVPRQTKMSPSHGNDVPLRIERTFSGNTRRTHRRTAASIDPSRYRARKLVGCRRMLWHG